MGYIKAFIVVTNGNWQTEMIVIRTVTSVNVHCEFHYENRSFCKVRWKEEEESCTWPWLRGGCDSLVREQRDNSSPLRSNGNLNMFDISEQIDHMLNLLVRSWPHSLLKNNRCSRCGFVVDGNQEKLLIYVVFSKAFFLRDSFKRFSRKYKC